MALMAELGDFIWEGEGCGLIEWNPSFSFASGSLESFRGRGRKDTRQEAVASCPAHLDLKGESGKWRAQLAITCPTGIRILRGGRGIGLAP